MIATSKGVPYVLGIASLLAALSLACPGGSSGGGGGGVRIVSAVLTDSGTRGEIDTGDTILVTFSAPVSIQGAPPLANTVFTPSGSLDDWGTSTVTDPGAPDDEQVTITIATGAVFTPDGVYPDPGPPPASGINLIKGQKGLKPVRKKAGLGPSADPVDIEGTLDIGYWTTVSGGMIQARYAHTATLLPNGEILIVGGGHDLPSIPNPAEREALASIEIFDPSNGTFRLAADRLVQPRFRHRATRTPGSDGVIDTADDYVVIVGGVGSERTTPVAGVRSEPAVEVIVPDWNGDGDTTDLVVNPDATGNRTGVPVAEFPAVDLPVGPLGSIVSVRVGPTAPAIEWAPGLFEFSDPTPPSGFPADNELVMLSSGIIVTVRDSAGDFFQAILVTWGPGYVPLSVCEDAATVIVIDPDNDRDLTDSFIGYLANPGAPRTSPVSLARIGHSQTRLPGPDGLLGTPDDAQAIYGGFGVDSTAVCQGGVPDVDFCGDSSTFADLVWWDPVMGFTWTGLNGDSPFCDPTTCGFFGCPPTTTCSTPGVGSTDRSGHDAVPLKDVVTGGVSNEIALIGGHTGAYFSGGVQACPRAVEIITPDLVATPRTWAIATIGLDDENGLNRVTEHTADRFDGSGNILVAGGHDLVPGSFPASIMGSTTDKAAYIQPRIGATPVAPVAPMIQRRQSHASVSLPASVWGFAADRVYVFGGLARDFPFPAVPVDLTIPQVTTSTVEYFRESYPGP